MKRHMLNLIACFTLAITVMILIPMVALAEGMPEAESVFAFLSGYGWGGWVIMGLAILGFASFIATAIIMATPSPEDDAKLAEIKAHKIWGFIIRFLEAFALKRLTPKK